MIKRNLARDLAGTKPDPLSCPSDGERFLRLVELLALVPEDTYAEARAMVTRLIDENPDSIDEWETDLDAAIHFLENRFEKPSH